MAVYVDNFYLTGVTFRGMKMCHMIADTSAELIEMVDKIGVQRKWIQHPGTPNEHFDICFSKRQKAIKMGAIEIGMREYAERVQKLAAINNIHWTRVSIDKIGIDFGQGRDVTVISEIRSGAIIKQQIVIPFNQV